MRCEKKERSPSPSYSPILATKLVQCEASRCLVVPHTGVGPETACCAISCDSASFAEVIEMCADNRLVSQQCVSRLVGDLPGLQALSRILQGSQSIRQVFKGNRLFCDGRMKAKAGKGFLVVRKQSMLPLPEKCPHCKRLSGLRMQARARVPTVSDPIQPAKAK